MNIKWIIRILVAIGLGCAAFFYWWFDYIINYRWTV